MRGKDGCVFHHHCCCSAERSDWCIIKSCESLLLNEWIWYQTNCKMCSPTSRSWSWISSPHCWSWGVWLKTPLGPIHYKSQSCGGCSLKTFISKSYGGGNIQTQQRKVKLDSNGTHMPVTPATGRNLTQEKAMWGERLQGEKAYESWFQRQDLDGKLGTHSRFQWLSHFLRSLPNLDMTSGRDENTPEEAWNLLFDWLKLGQEEEACTVLTSILHCGG